MYEKKMRKTFACGMSVIMEIIGGKWKAYLIHCINHGVRRPSDLQRRIHTASRRVLNLQLRELEDHGIIKRTIYAELPLRVEYYLTDFGESLLPVIAAMETWGDQYLDTFNLLEEERRAKKAS
ncbi:winged helix-turn-helix transcriptional regulator [Chitinophaga vietnamensis]|uniref:winged helix-turn-helix transcriptional regulator n=1 Tax=Chitinophaga vietnamensis TaxID=2593957 RepID=UPI0011784812|nr:helix-turn-helix domain-containing protein [Chitinophaga vietnamensis]